MGLGLLLLLKSRSLKPYNFHILPNDIVFIPQTKLVKWNNVISLLTPSETLFKTYKPYIAEQDDWYILSDNENVISGN